ncbi:MAG: nicotinate-nucleotide--dimethylbenzimidazole phosphoribosyltransferase, partial [Acidimicrobiia bacterium]
VHKTQSVVSDALGRVGVREPIGLLAGLGGPEIAHLAGVIVGVAGAGGVVVLDGFVTAVAALVADRLSPGLSDHLVAGQQSNERAHASVLEALGLEALLHLRLRAGEGIGAALATRMLLDACSIREAAPRMVGAGLNPG